MYQFLKSLFFHPSADVLKLQQLKKAERELLEYEESVEEMVAMRDMLRARVTRLTHH